MKNSAFVKQFIQRLGWSLLASVFVVFLVLSLGGSAGSSSPLILTQPIPKQSDWIDYGPIFKSGDVGQWDYILWGGFAGTAIKKSGVYYLYYQGISGYQLIPDETVTWRTIGVATSPDGINFTKYSNNPVITWFPNNDGEEGATSGGVTLNNSGNIAMYYGANTAFSPTLVNADGRLATSANGFTFTDQGVAIDHTDGSLWGSGDELFPVIAFQDAGQWFVYYIPNGTLQARKLGVAWGNDPKNLSNSAPALSGAASISAWGMGGYAKVGPGTYALFINDVTQSKTEVRTVSLNAPSQLSAPVETYQFPDVQQATVLLDEATHTWFMYYRGSDEYGVKLAPAGSPDTTPPTAPSGVMATPLSERQINLSWNPATDTETGIVLYNIFRNGVKVATVKGWNFKDTGLVEQTGYSYKVSAVNYHGVEGPQSTPVIATTLADVTPPRVVSVNTGASSTQVTVTFNEPVAQASASKPANYAITGDITVTGASLLPDLKTVILTTSPHVEGIYHIAIKNVRDQATAPNLIDSGTAVIYTHTGIAGLAGAWTFNESAGQTVADTANFGNDGALLYTNKPGPSWTAGKIGSALLFDGNDDQVTISGSRSLGNVTDGNHTFAAWVNPGSTPPGTTNNNTSYSVLVRRYTGLYYDHNQKFRAEIRLSSGNVVSVSSGVFASGVWHHLVMVVDNTNKKLHLYVDGQAVNASPVSYSGTLADHEDAPYYLGTSEPLTNYYEYRFKGKIDEARIYNRALTPVEVQKLFAWFPLTLPQFPAYLPVIIKNN